MVFLNEKTTFYSLETRSSKSRKIDIFPKGLVHGFGPKWPFFQLIFFLSNIGQKIDILPKGLDNGFGPHWPFLKLFFRQYMLEKCVLWYYATKTKLFIR